MSDIEVFRTYPAPNTSWRRWDIKLDGHVVGRIGGAGSKVICAEPGSHDLSVRYGVGERQSLSVTVTDDRATMVLVGMGVGRAGGVGAKECDKLDDLPKGAIPIHAPGGNTQTLAQGRAKAVAGLAVVIGIDLLFWVIGAVAVAKDIWGNDPFRVVIGVGGFAEEWKRWAG
jgi:hypothetical protein